MAEGDRPHDPTALRIESTSLDGTYSVVIAGELDAASCEALEQALQRAEASGPETVLIDLDGLTFVDSTGLRTILAAKRRADTDVYTLRITRGTGYVADMFRLTALDRTLPFI